MKKQHKYSTKQKHPAETSTNTSLSASSSVDTISIKQKHFEQLEKILLTPLNDSTEVAEATKPVEYTMRDFIFDHILYSIAAADITNGQKIKYIKIIEQFLLKSAQKIDETTARFQLCELMLHKLISTREHLKTEKCEESVVEYLVNSEVFGKNLFNPNKLDKYNLTLLDLLKSLQGTLNIKKEINENKKLIQRLEKKGAKSSLEITQNLNPADYNKNVEKLKEKLKEDSSISMRKSAGYLCVSKKVSALAEDLGTSAELLDCLYAILNYKTEDIAKCMRLFFPKVKSESELRVVDKLLRECYKDIDINNYIKIISSIVEDIPSDLLKMILYEELCEELIRQCNKTRLLTKTKENLLDDYTSKIVALSMDDNNGIINNDTTKHRAYKLRLSYWKYKANSQETIKISLELIKYANNTQMGEDLYGLLMALYSIEIGSFKDKILADLVAKFELSGEAREMFTKLFSYHHFDRAFVKKIQKELEIIEQAFSEHKPEIRTTITKFSRAFIIQTGECSVSTMQEIINDPDFESATPESASNILSCLKNWSKDKIEQINYQKVLDKLLNKEHLEKDPITNIKLAELYLAIEDLVQTKYYLDSAEKLLKVRTLCHTSFQHAAINPKVYLSEFVKLGFMLKAFEDKNKDFLKANLSYIKKTYENCCAIKEEFSSAYQNILDICQYYLLSIDSTTDPNLGEKLRNIIHNITEDDEVTFALEIINQTISEEQRIKEQHISEKQQIVIPASEHIDASYNYVSKEYSSEEKSETEADNTATTQEDSLYKESFVTKYLNHWTIIHQYYQNLKKSARSSHDKTSDSHQEDYQIWNIPDNISYTTKNEGSSTSIVCNIGKKHHNIYAVINPGLLDSLQKSQQQAFTTALKKGLVKNYNQHGIKILGKYLPELKIAGDNRLYATKIYKNDNGAVLIEFDKEANHTGINNAVKYTAINVIKVYGAIGHHTQEEDSTLKYNIPQRRLS